MYAIATNNFIFDKANPYCMTAQDIADGFNLAASTVGNKAAELRRMFDISYFNTEWVLQEHIRDNPAVWMLQVDGFVVDICTMPLDIQQLAFEKGLIPYVPGEENR